PLGLRGRRRAGALGLQSTAAIAGRGTIPGGSGEQSGHADDSGSAKANDPWRVATQDTRNPSARDNALASRRRNPRTRTIQIPESPEFIGSLLDPGTGSCGHSETLVGGTGDVSFATIGRTAARSATVARI